MDLLTSSVILATAVEPVSASFRLRNRKQAAVFGPMRIVPSKDGRFGKNNELRWSSGIRSDGGRQAGRVDRLHFHLRQPDGTGEILQQDPAPGAERENIAAGVQHDGGTPAAGSLIIPMAPFPAGEYRQEIKVTDKPSGKVVTQNVNFTVTG